MTGVAFDMRTRVMLVALIVVAATACSGTSTDSADTTAGTTAPAPTAAPAPGETSAPSDEAPAETAAPAPTQADRVRPEGRDAPDFALSLGQGGDFVLSAESKPVYMVFWAEW